MENLLFNAISTYCIQHTLINPGSTIVVGLSGGPDSVFLLHYLQSHAAIDNLTVIAAHLDHGWRAESGDDAQWCMQLAQNMGIPCVTQKLSELTGSIKHNGSQEELGRKARRLFLENVRTQHKADVIALAHHADDQQETFFIRLVRGASLTGLTGMKPRHGLYVRPLLPCYKKDILAYLHAHAIPYLTDPSNESDQYLRNRVRNKVIPALHTADPRFAHTFARTMKNLQQTEEYLNAQAHKELQNILQDNALNMQAFLQLPPLLQQRILVNWFCMQQIPFTPSQALFAEIMRFLKQNKHNTHQLYKSWQLHKKADTVSIRKI